MQELIDAARQAAFALEAQTNKDASDRIDQINNVIQNTVSEVNALENKTAADIYRILDKYSDRLQTIETDTFKQLTTVINDAECAADKTLTVHLQDALGGFGRLIDASSFEVNPPLIYPTEQECHILCGPPKLNLTLANFD